MKKKIVLFLCATICMFSVTACSNTNSTQAEKPAENAEETVEEADVAEETDTEEVKEDTEEDETVVSDTTADEDAGQEITDAESDDAASDIDEADISMAELYNIISESVELVNPMEIPEDFLENYYGIDVATLADYACYMSETAISAETLFMIKAQNEEDAKTITEIVNTVKEEKAAEMEDYLPEQFAIVNSGLIESYGNYVWLVISENADKINSIIEENIKVK